MIPNDDVQVSPPEADDTAPLIYTRGDQIVINRQLAYSLVGMFVLIALAVIILVAVPGVSASIIPKGIGAPKRPDAQALLAEVNPPEGYTLNVHYGVIGPKLLAAGAIDRQAFIKLYDDSGNPLTDEEIAILTQGSDQKITINQRNAHFLLNVLWAFGLTNKNPILDQGPLKENSGGDISRYASTGGWTLGTKTAAELYSSVGLVQLTPGQQALVEEAAANTFRPCCNNSTAFADCNHGMAMLGLYEVMASQGATLGEMYQAAKYFNAFWFPQQALQLALYFHETANQSFANVEPRVVVSAQHSSARGSQAIQAWLAQKGLLPEESGGGGCGV